MLKRCGLVIPLYKVARDCAWVDCRMHPFGAWPALVGFDDVATHDDDWNAIAPGIVHRHRCMLQTDHAVANHGHRLALDLGVTLCHVNCDFFVRAGEDLWLRISTMIEHGFVQSAETGRAIHRQIVDVECLEHVDHEISTTGRLTDRILRWRHCLNRRKPRSGNRGFGASLRWIGCLRTGDNRRR